MKALAYLGLADFFMSRRSLLVALDASQSARYICSCNEVIVFAEARSQTPMIVALNVRCRPGADIVPQSYVRQKAQISN